MSETDNLTDQVVRKVRRISTEAAFRASLEQRLLNLESQLGEIRLRLNGLLFFIAGAVIADALTRLVAR